MPPPSPDPIPSWHTLSVERICALLASSPTGLTDAEAAGRLAAHGPNELEAAHRVSAWVVLNRPFTNTWLNLAIGWELLLLTVVVYLPALREPFGTYGLSLIDGVIVVALAFTVSPVLEIAKALERRGWFGGAS